MEEVHQLDIINCMWEIYKEFTFSDIIIIIIITNNSSLIVDDNCYLIKFLKISCHALKSVIIHGSNFVPITQANPPIHDFKIKI
jgi:hypothetical protein